MCKITQIGKNKQFVAYTAGCLLRRRISWWQWFEIRMWNLHIPYHVRHSESWIKSTSWNEGMMVELVLYWCGSIYKMWTMWKGVCCVGSEPWFYQTKVLFYLKVWRVHTLELGKINCHSLLNQQTQFTTYIRGRYLNHFRGHLRNL
jgi:hypothetical protein